MVRVAYTVIYRTTNALHITNKWC